MALNGQFRQVIDDIALAGSRGNQFDMVLKCSLELRRRTWCGRDMDVIDNNRRRRPAWQRYRADCRSTLGSYTESKFIPIFHADSNQ